MQTVLTEQVGAPVGCRRYSQNTAQNSPLLRTGKSSTLPVTSYFPVASMRGRDSPMSMRYLGTSDLQQNTIVNTILLSL
jgi:hypothetical protein